jgi:hypothetical protein
MTVDRQARTTLRNAIVGYMGGAIRTFAFEDQYSPCRNSPDEAVQEIVRQIWYIHDELIDHPISITEQGWQLLRRTVAFVGTDLEITAEQNGASWPFEDEAAWHANEHLVNEIDLPECDAAVHGRPANPWWNRIPSSVGFLVLAVLLGAVFVVIALS